MASRYQKLRSHLAKLKLHAAAEALPVVLDQATAEGLSLSLRHFQGVSVAILAGAVVTPPMRIALIASDRFPIRFVMHFSRWRHPRPSRPGT
ncbi:hypothetical protein ACVWWN_000384 [Mycobacterium sp. URHB0021]